MKLFEPLETSHFTFKNRIVMAPMSRRRAINGVLPDYAADYFSQRASAGLVITDNVVVSPDGYGYLGVPAIYHEPQVEAWKKVAAAVHEKGGTIFMQLVHAGRVGHHLNQQGLPVVAPSAVQCPGEVRVPGDRYLDKEMPVALSTAAIEKIADDFVQAARNAIRAGFDGVEVHGAHGYLLNQFLHPHTNRREDIYGGSMKNRAKLLLDITASVASEVGAGRTGIRLSPFSTNEDLPPVAEEAAMHYYLTEQLTAMDILYISLSDLSTYGDIPPIPKAHIAWVRKHFPNYLLLAGGYTRESGEEIIQSGLADLVGYARSYIANPDLVERFRNDHPLATPDFDTFYHGGERGYVDYPAYKY